MHVLCFLWCFTSRTSWLQERHQRLADTRSSDVWRSKLLPLQGRTESSLNRQGNKCTAQSTVTACTPLPTHSSEKSLRTHSLLLSPITSPTSLVQPFQVRALQNYAATVNELAKSDTQGTNFRSILTEAQHVQRKNDTLKPPCPALFRARNLVEAGCTSVAQRSTT